MSISCEVIKDLLPLYADGICSNESKKLVEEHLKKCEGCKRQFSNMKTDISSPKIIENEKDKVKALNKFAKNYNTKKIRTFVLGVLICAVVCLVGIVGYNYYYVTPVEVLPSESFTVKDSKRLVNGFILVEFEYKDLYKNTEVKTEIEDGNYVIKAYCPRAKTLKSSGEVYTTYKMLTSIKIDGDLVETNEGENINGIYLGENNSDNVVWEKGMDVPEYGGKALDKDIIGDEEYLNKFYYEQNSNDNIKVSLSSDNK